MKQMKENQRENTDRSQQREIWMRGGRPEREQRMGLNYRNGNVWRKQQPQEGKEKRKVKVKRPQLGKQTVSQKKWKQIPEGSRHLAQNQRSLPQRDLTQQGLCCCCRQVAHPCPTLCDPAGGSPPGSPVPGILQASTLEWVAISFSNA